MKKKMMVFFMIAGLFSIQHEPAAGEEIVLSATEDREVFDLIQRSLTVTDMPYPVVYLLMDEEYTIEQSGLNSKKEHVLIKILKESGQDFGNVSLSYNSYYQDLEVIKARTIRSDGSVMKVLPETIQDKSPYVGYPIYSDILIKEISFPAAEPGNFIEYEVVWKDKKPVMEKGGFGFFRFPFGFLTQSARLKVTFPKTANLKFQTFKILQDTPTVTETTDKKLYLWEMKNVFPIHSFEVAKPPYREIGPAIFFTTINSWKDVSGWFGSLAKGQANYDDTIRQTVLDLVGKNIINKEENREEIIKALYYYVSQKIRYVAVELEESAFKPYEAKDVLYNQYGDCKGKSSLLIAMLKVLDIPAYYALLRTRSSGRTFLDFPSMDFNHCIVAIPRGDGYLFLDTTCDVCPFGQLHSNDQETDVLIVLDDRYQFERIPSSRPQENTVSTATTVKFQGATSAKITETNILTGETTIYWRSLVKNMQQPALNDLISRLLNLSLPGARLDKITFSDVDNLDVAFEINSEYSAENFASRAGNLIMFSLPDDSASDFLPLAGSETRKYPIWLSSPYVSEEKTVVFLPEGYKVRFLPENITLDYTFASYAKNFSLEDKKLTIDTRFVLKTANISAGKFGQMKNMVKKIQDVVQQQIVLEKISTE